VDVQYVDDGKGKKICNSIVVEAIEFVTGRNKKTGAI
jgi:hypothetical protein